ncbi:hypothetical protein ACQ4PT_025443 [Festuca glaucescens]
MVSGEASLPLHAAETAETGTGGDRGPPSDLEEEEADGSSGGEEGDDMDEDEDGGASNDNDGEEEEEDMDFYSSSSSQEPDEEQEQLASHLEVWESLQTKMEESGDGMEHRNPAVASCCVCMEPWTSGGAHRIFCIPCGHVYGRSCLEKWLGRCGGTMAKCPQCGESFEHKMIINLYGTEYLWNDCIHDQARLDEEKRLREEFERRQLVALEERMAEFERRQLEAFEERMAALREERQEELLAALAAHQEKFTAMLAAKEARCHEMFTAALAAQQVEQQAMWHQTFTVSILQIIANRES